MVQNWFFSSTCMTVFPARCMTFSLRAQADHNATLLSGRHRGGVRARARVCLAQYHRGSGSHRHPPRTPLAARVGSPSPTLHIARCSVCLYAYCAPALPMFRRKQRAARDKFLGSGRTKPLEYAKELILERKGDDWNNTTHPSTRRSTHAIGRHTRWRGRWVLVRPFGGLCVIV